MNISAKQTAPGQFALDLALQSVGGRSSFAKISVKCPEILLEILLCNLTERRFDLCFGNCNFVGFGFLNLQCFVDQVAQNLNPKPLAFFVGNPAAISGDDQREAMIDIGTGDNVPVDDSGGLANIRIVLREYCQLFRDVQTCLRNTGVPKPFGR